MKIRITCLILLLSVLFIFSCKPPIKGKVEITEQEFSIRKDASVWVVDVRGKVKNVGEADIKNIEITGFCDSCGEVLSARVWYKSVYEKQPQQKCSINYLPVGAEEQFSFKEIAYFFNNDGSKPDSLPDKLRCQITSYETIEK